MTKSYVRTATRSTLKVEANLTQILNFKANFHTEFEPFFKKKIYANNGGHFKIVSIKIKFNIVHIKPYNLKNSSNIKVPKYCHAQVSLLDKQGSSYIKLHLILTTAFIHVWM